MYNSKLQIGCLLVVAYIIFIYCRECRASKRKHIYTLYDGLLVIGVISLIFDGITAYTVNHLEVVNRGFNIFAHMIFLLSLDAAVFWLFLYIRSMTEEKPTKKMRLLLYTPFIINVVIVITNMESLEYRQGNVSNYSMGVSAYTCFIMVAVYMIFTLFYIFRRWNYIESHKRTSILTFIGVMIFVTGIQMIYPEVLLTSIATTILILGAYMNQEDPARRELEHYHDEMVMGFATLIESKDDSTGGHVKRTTMYVKMLVEELLARGYYQDILTKDYRNNIQMAAPMHDIGKIAIPDAILQKPGKLTAEEFEEMKLHTVKGGAIIQETFGNLRNDEYQTMAHDVALYHHEKWNGKGYPEGLKGEEIPLCARIMAIADVFDAVSERRCYRDALPLDQCFAIIEDGIGKDFDPVIAKVFVDSRDQVEALMR